MQNNNNNWSGELAKIFGATLITTEGTVAIKKERHRGPVEWAQDKWWYGEKVSQEKKIAHWQEQNGVELKEATQDDVHRVMEEGHVNAGYKFVANEEKDFIIFGNQPENLYRMGYEECYQAMCKATLGKAKELFFFKEAENKVTKMNENLEECNEMCKTMLEQQRIMEEIMRGSSKSKQELESGTYTQYVCEKESDRNEQQQRR
jgi:hypothetical protein